MNDYIESHVPFLKSLRKLSVWPMIWLKPCTLLLASD